MIPLLSALQNPWWCPMCGAGMRWGWGMGIVMIAVWLIALWLILALVWQLIVRRGANGGPGPGEDRAEEILRQRYARGEIDHETYDRMLKDLHGRTGAFPSGRDAFRITPTARS